MPVPIIDCWPPAATFRMAEAEARAERQRMQSRRVDRLNRASSHAARTLMESSADRATARISGWESRHLACLVNLDRARIMRERSAAEQERRKADREWRRLESLHHENMQLAMRSWPATARPQSARPRVRIPNRQIKPTMVALPSACARYATPGPGSYNPGESGPMKHPRSSSWTFGAGPVTGCSAA